MEQLLKPSDLCTKLRVSIDVLDEMQEQGKLPEPIRLGPRTRRWREADINQWIADGCQPAAGSDVE